MSDAVVKLSPKRTQRFSCYRDAIGLKPGPT
jgi:hypothetical protein